MKTVYVKDGILSYEYNLFEIARTTIKAKDKLPTGKVKIEVETSYVERKAAGPLKVVLKVHGKEGEREACIESVLALVHRVLGCQHAGQAFHNRVMQKMQSSSLAEFVGMAEHVIFDMPMPRPDTMVSFVSSMAFLPLEIKSLAFHCQI